MNLLVAASAALILIATVFLISSFRHLRRGRLLRASSAFVFGSVSVSMGAMGLLVLISYTGYERLVEEQPVAAIEFTHHGPNEFMARLMIEGQLDRILPLRGDEWQLDARIVSWRGPATVLGLDPVYRLERISGRYADIERERISARSVHSLSGERALDLWSLARSFPALMPGVDAYYGTATFLPMADGARYGVTLSRDALIARPLNLPAEQALGRWGRVPN